MTLKSTVFKKYFFDKNVKAQQCPQHYEISGICIHSLIFRSELLGVVALENLFKGLINKNLCFFRCIKPLKNQRSHSLNTSLKNRQVAFLIIPV